MFRSFLLILCCSTISAPAFAADVDVNDLQKRVEELEKRQQEIFTQQHDQEGRVRPFLDNSILFGGYFETGITHFNGPNTKSQYMANSHVIGLNIAADLNEADRITAQIQTGLGYTFANPHNDPRGNPKQRQSTTAVAPTILTQAYLEHKFDQRANLQMGLGYSPFGQAYQWREPVLFKERGGPQMLSSGNNVSVGAAFPLWMGFHLYGNFNIGDDHFGYNLYTTTNSTNSKQIGGGARLWYKLAEFATFGISSQIGAQGNSATYNSYGTDVDLKFGRYGVTMEAIRNMITHGQEPIKTYYATPYVNLFKNHIVVYALADYLDNPRQLTGSLTDPIKKWEVGGGVNWLPTPGLRFRLGYLEHKYVGENSVRDGQQRNAYSIDLSLAAAF